MIKEKCYWCDGTGESWYPDGPDDVTKDICAECNGHGYVYILELTKEEADHVKNSLDYTRKRCCDSSSIDQAESKRMSEIKDSRD